MDDMTPASVIQSARFPRQKRSFYQKRSRGLIGGRYDPGPSYPVGKVDVAREPGDILWSVTPLVLLPRASRHHSLRRGGGGLLREPLQQAAVPLEGRLVTDRVALEVGLGPVQSAGPPFFHPPGQPPAETRVW